MQASRSSRTRGVVGDGDGELVLERAGAHLAEALGVQRAGVGDEHDLGAGEHQRARGLRLLAVEADHQPDADGVAPGQVELDDVEAGARLQRGLPPPGAGVDLA